MSFVNFDKTLNECAVYPHASAQRHTARPPTAKGSTPSATEGGVCIHHTESVSKQRSPHILGHGCTHRRVPNRRHSQQQSHTNHKSISINTCQSRINHMLITHKAHINHTSIVHERGTESDAMAWRRRRPTTRCKMQDFLPALRPYTCALFSHVVDEIAKLLFFVFLRILELV